MEIVAFTLSTFGAFGFVLALGAYHKASKLEDELKRRKLIDEEFDGDQ